MFHFVATCPASAGGGLIGKCGRNLDVAGDRESERHGQGVDVSAVTEEHEITGGPALAMIDEGSADDGSTHSSGARAASIVKPPASVVAV